MGYEYEVSYYSHRYKAIYPNQSEIDTKDITGASHHDQDDDPSLLRSVKEIKKTRTENTSLR